MGFHKSFGHADATALQHHIKSGKTAYIASGKVTGNAYTPAMMKFDGSTGFYNITGQTTTGNSATMVARFKNPGFTGNVVEYIAAFYGNSAIRIAALLVSSNHASLPNRRSKLQVFVLNSSGVEICKLISTSTFLDDVAHTLFFSYNAATAAFTFVVDGVAEDDAGNPDRVAPTTGTLQTSTGSIASVGALSGGTNPNSGQIGFVGYRDAYLTNWSDFMYSDGLPKPPTESGGWGGWGAQPLFWNEHGQMDNNLGSGGNMTRNGTIVIGKGGNT